MNVLGLFLIFYFFAKRDNVKPTLQIICKNDVSLMLAFLGFFCWTQVEFASR